jgi:DNA-binding NtrC family response regulator
VPALTEAARRALVAHRWPGNIRELSHTLERAVVLSGGETIDATDLGLRLPKIEPAAAAAVAEARPAEPAANVAPGVSASQGEGQVAAAAVQVAPAGVAVDFSAGPVSMETVERDLLFAALEKAGGSKTEAGRLLGMSRDMFRYRLSKYESS